MAGAVQLAGFRQPLLDRFHRAIIPAWQNRKRMTLVRAELPCCYNRGLY
jgi:hypothetical protein